MCPKTLIDRVLQNLVSEISRMSEADLVKIVEGTHELSLRVTRKRAAPKSVKVDYNSQYAEILDRLRSCQSREEGFDILSDTFTIKKELEQFARFLDVMVLKQDKAEAIKTKIVESTIGAVLRSNAIHGKSQSRLGD